MPAEAYRLVAPHAFENGNVVEANTVAHTSKEETITDSRDGYVLVQCLWSDGKIGSIPLRLLRKL